MYCTTLYALSRGSDDDSSHNRRNILMKQQNRQFFVMCARTIVNRSFFRNSTSFPFQFNANEIITTLWHEWTRCLSFMRSNITIHTRSARSLCRTNSGWITRTVWFSLVHDLFQFLRLVSLVPPRFQKIGKTTNTTFRWIRPRCGTFADALLTQPYKGRQQANSKENSYYVPHKL